MTSRLRENSNRQTRFTVKVDASDAAPASALTAADYTLNRYRRSQRSCASSSSGSDNSLSMQKLLLSLLRFGRFVVVFSIVIGSLGAIMSSTSSSAHAARIGNFSAFVWHRNLLPDFDQGVLVCVYVCVCALGVKVVDLFSYITRIWRTRRNSSCVHWTPMTIAKFSTDPLEQGRAHQPPANPFSLLTEFEQHQTYFLNAAAATSTFTHTRASNTHSYTCICRSHLAFSTHAWPQLPNPLELRSTVLQSCRRSSHNMLQTQLNWQQTKYTCPEAPPVWIISSNIEFVHAKTLITRKIENLLQRYELWDDLTKDCTIINFIN